jgi:hypothetical protein
MILGLSGKVDAGKNTVAQRLAVLSPIPVVEISYAAKLKESAAALFGVRVADLERWKNNPVARVTISAPGGVHHQQTVREMLQRYGTESHRDVFGADFWLDAALPSNVVYDATGDKAALYVVTDVRFQNEADRIRELGGTVVRVVGPNNETGSHPTERPTKADVVIKNKVRDDNFASLDAELVKLLANLKITAPGSDAEPSAEAA